MAWDVKPNSRRLVLLFWMLVAVYYFYVSYDYIRVEMNDDRLADYVRYVAQLAGNESRTPREVRALLLVRADELGLPLRTDQIKILGRGNNLKIQVQYDVDIDVPILSQGFYSKHFVHTATYRQPR
jgi:hypothetical protein